MGTKDSVLEKIITIHKRFKAKKLITTYKSFKPRTMILGLFFV